MSAAETRTLAALIERKHECLVGLRDLGLRQFELIDGGDLSQLLKLLSTKQHVIDLLQAIERDLTPFRQQDPEHRQWASPAERDRCAQQAEACQRLLAEIVAQEKQSESSLVARRDLAAQQIQGASVAGQARQAYTQFARRESGLVDFTSETHGFDSQALS